MRVAVGQPALLRGYDHSRGKTAAGTVKISSVKISASSIRVGQIAKTLFFRLVEFPIRIAADEWRLSRPCR